MADDESIRGSLKGRLPRFRDKGKHKAKIMASREALGRGGSMFDLTTRPTTAPNQLIEDWNIATQAELEAGKGGLFSAFKEKVQVVAQRQAQAQIEKELKEVNEFRTKVAASVDEKLLDYTVQMQAANRNIAGVTARLHNLSSNITEDKITQLLTDIVKPYFDALSGLTSQRLDLMEERSNRAENDRTEKFERELMSSADRNGAAEAKMEDIFTMATDATVTTERQLSEVSSALHDIKLFTETIPRLAAETRASTESATTKLVQSAELAARQIIQEAEDSNRAETAKLNQLRTDELRKLERSLQSIGDNTIQTMRTDLSNLTRTMSSATSDQVETINHAVTRGKVHVEYIQDNIEKADRKLDRSFKNLASEIKQLNEDVTNTMTRTQTAERLAKASVTNIESSLTSAKASIETAEKNLSNMKIDVERLNEKFLENGATVFENFEHGFGKMKRDSGIFLDDYVQEIESKTTVAGNTVAAALDHLITQAGDSFNGFVENFQDVSARSAEDFQRTHRESGVFLDDCLQKFEQNSAKSGKSLEKCARKIEENTAKAELSIAKSFSRLTKETEDSLDGHVEAIHIVTSQAGEAVSFVSEGLENLKQDFVHSLDGCAEKIQNSLSQAGGTVFEVQQSMEKLRSEATNHLNIQVERIEKSNSSTESSISSVRIGLEMDLNNYVERIQCLNTQSEKSLVSVISQELERTKTETTNYLDTYTKRIEGVNDQAEATLSVVTNILERIASDSSKAMDVYALKIEDFGLRAGENLGLIVSDRLDMSKKDIEKCLDTYVDRIQSISTCAEESLASSLATLVQKIEAVNTGAGETLSIFLPELDSALERSLINHETMAKTLNGQFLSHHQDLAQNIKLDMVQWSEKKDHETQTLMQSIETLAAEKRLAHQSELEAWEQKKRDELCKSLERWDIAFDGKMVVAVESFIQRLEVHSRNIQEVALTSKEEMAERYVTTLETCNEERKAHAKDLKSVDGRLEALSRVINWIAREMGGFIDPFMGSGIKPSDSPVTTPGLKFSSSTTFKSRFDEASGGISELLDFCKVFRSHVNDISRAVGTVASGETFSTMLHDNTRMMESLVRLIGNPNNNSSLWSVIEGIEDSRKKTENAYDRLETVFQETRTFISNANDALGYVPVTLQDISTSATEIAESTATSQAFSDDSRTLTDSLSINMRSSVQALARCKGDFEKISEAIKISRDSILEGKKAAEFGNTIASDMQEVLFETSKSIGEMVSTTSGMGKSLEISKTTIEGFRIGVDFFKDSVLRTKESVDRSSALTKFYEEDVKTIGTEFKTAIETLRHVTGSICTLRDSVCSVREEMNRTKVTVGETRKTVEDLNGDIGDAEFSISSFTASLTSLGETIEATDTSFATISTTVFETKESLKKLGEYIRDPETMVEKTSIYLNALTEIAQAAELSVVEASTLIRDKSKEMSEVEISSLAEPEPNSHLAARDDSGNNGIDALQVSTLLRPQSPKRLASTVGDWNQDGSAQEESVIRQDAGQDAAETLQTSFNESLRSITQSEDTKSPSRPRSASNKRRRLGSFFYIPQWMSTPVEAATKDASDYYGTSTATGNSMKNSGDHTRGKDESGSSRNELAVDNHGSALGDVEAVPTIPIEQSQVDIQPPQKHNSNADELSGDAEAETREGHVRCGDCMDGVLVPANASKSGDGNADVVSDTADRSGVPDIAVPAIAVLVGGRTRRNRGEEESTYVSNEAMMLWRHRTL